MLGKRKLGVRGQNFWKRKFIGGPMWWAWEHYYERATAPPEPEVVGNDVIGAPTSDERPQMGNGTIGSSWNPVSRWARLELGTRL